MMIWKKWIFYLIRTHIKAYRSQSSTWILLLPALLFALLKGELNKVMVGNSLTNSDIENISPRRPFYQFHRNMNRSEWFTYVDNI